MPGKLSSKKQPAEALGLADALPPLKRGRPRAAWFTALEVATWLDVDEGVVRRSLELEKFRKSLWPHAEKRGEPGVWMIAERDLQRLLGTRLPRPLWVSEFAEFIGYSVAQVNLWIRSGEIPSVMIYGRRRVMESVIWALPKHLPVRERKCPTIRKRVCVSEEAAVAA